MPGFKLLFDCNNNQFLELEKEDTNWVPTDWADYMDPNAMTMLLRDAICNIEEEEYWEACQHTLKSPYEARTSDKDEERGEAPVMMMKVVIVVVVTMIVETVKMIAIVIVKATTVKTMIANIVAMTGLNPLVIKKMKMKGFTINTIMMM